jgi:tetratricopeptide (TPR) repeat protein
MLTGDPAALGCWAALLSLMVNAAFSSPLYLPAGAALLAILLGAVEAAAAGRVWTLPATVPARAAGMVLAAALCAAAWPYCWNRGAVDLAVGQASGALARGDMESADAALQEALRRDPSHMEAWSLTGRLRFERGQYDAAAAAFERALRAGYNPNVFEARAGALWKSGRRAEAIAQVEQLVRLRPDLGWAARELRLLRAAPAVQASARSSP